MQRILQRLARDFQRFDGRCLHAVESVCVLEQRLVAPMPQVLEHVGDDVLDAVILLGIEGEQRTQRLGECGILRAKAIDQRHEKRRKTNSL